MISDVYEFHFFYINFKTDYVKSTLDNQFIDSYLNMTVLFLSNCLIASNPYVKAKLVEILYYLYQADKNKVNSILVNNTPARNNITACKTRSSNEKPSFFCCYLIVLSFSSLKQSKIIQMCFCSSNSPGEVLHRHWIHRWFPLVLLEV